MLAALPAAPMAAGPRLAGYFVWVRIGEFLRPLLS
jgi:hypothetical protein